MNIVTYTRVSTRGQDTALQQAALDQYCQAHGFRIVNQYTDVATGSNTDRPGLQALMDCLHNHQAQAVVVYKLDRLGRSLRDLLRIVDEFRSLGVDFVSMHESIDTSSPTGKLMFHLIASLSEFEREMINGRCAAGRERALAEGVQFGRPRRNVDVDAILRRAAAGVPIAQIARIHKVSRGVVRDRIKEARAQKRVL
jgi:DNA invertase Pin-like site-specific DNA recombinase